MNSQTREEAFHQRLPGRPYVVRQAITLADLHGVHRLAHDSIVYAGYMGVQRGSALITYPDLDCAPETTILVADAQGRIVGTNSLTADGPMGLHTDHEFPGPTNAVREEGRRLVSSFRIATEPAWEERRSFALVLDLIRASLVVALDRYDFQTILCTFNPKHEQLYQRLLCATTVARLEALKQSAVEAGAVMMRIDRERLPARLSAEIDTLREDRAARGTVRQSLAGSGDTAWRKPVGGRFDAGSPGGTSLTF